MASRYGAFSRSARNAFTSSFSTARNRSHSGIRRNYLGNESAAFRRRCAETMIPLHSAIASAKLISHLSFSSRSTRSALPLGLRGYIDILPVRHMVVA